MIYLGIKRLKRCQRHLYRTDILQNWYSKPQQGSQVNNCIFQRRHKSLVVDQHQRHGATIMQCSAATNQIVFELTLIEPSRQPYAPHHVCQAL
jgi:hypothetical protein